jgi:hypothetical protein
MKSYSCRVCQANLFFENSVCLSCDTQLAYSRDERAIVPLSEDGTYVDADGGTWFACANRKVCSCTWLSDVEGGFCFSCRLTRTRPNDNDEKGMEQFTPAERAKRHLIVELDALGLPIVTRQEDPENGLAFDLLSSVEKNVVIGHANGLITIDLAETDQAHREKVRAKLEEPYRTMLGHFRHEVGHYFEGSLVFTDDERTTRAREIFGDDTASYQGAIDRHYAEGPPEEWKKEYISAYATMHPYEDFAETFAHYLHICDTIETAREFGLATVAAPTSFSVFRDVVIGIWLPLSKALNQINRSMGANDLYPFVIADPVLDKLEFVASLRTRQS